MNWTNGLNMRANSDVQDLVADVVELFDVEPPRLLAEDAPVLRGDASSASPYLIGLIGGKEVGKSSLVNAIVGQKISRSSNAGEGTAIAIAYCHEDAANEVRSLLAREVGDRFDIITHCIASQRRQVLVDLPDIDSTWKQHAQLTRRLLRQMLFPIWIQSIEKYADRAPQQLLAQVADGNDPANFLFCLNKVDQLIAREGDAAAIELRDDLAQRLARTLKLPAPPRVFLTNAKEPDQLDLPALRSTLANERSTRSVESSIELAGMRRRGSMLQWLRAQQLGEHAGRAQRLLENSQESLSARLAVPLAESVVPGIARNPAYRLEIADPVVARRMSRWPIVNVIQTTLSPLMLLVRKNLSAAKSVGIGVTSTSSLVSAHLNGEVRPFADLIQVAFAQLRSVEPTIATLYAHQKLWEASAATDAANDLNLRLAATIDRQRDAAVARLVERGGVFTAPIRWLLTIGAAIWFPLLQPLLEHALVAPLSWSSVHDLAALLVPLLGAAYLLHSAAFLLIWFAVLWMLLRWQTLRRVNRLIVKWSRMSRTDDDLSLQATGLNWLEELMQPLQQYQARMQTLAGRLNDVR